MESWLKSLNKAKGHAGDLECRVNILIVKTSAIGDVLHTLPALHTLRTHYPTARIAWLIEEEASGIVIGHPAVDEVIVSRRKQWLSRIKDGEWLATGEDIWRFIKALRARRYDLLIDFQGLLKSSVFIACCRADRKVGFGRGMAHAEGSYLFLSERVPPVSMDTHAVERELLLLKAIGLHCERVESTLPLSPADQKQAEQLLVARGLASGEPFVAINPMTTWPTKHWQESGFVDVATRLLEQGLKVVFTGGKGDVEAINTLCSRLTTPGVLNLAGSTNLKTLAALFTKARLLVTTDTGPMHLAAAVGTPVVALFGPTAPWRTGPYGAGHQVIRAGLACSPCYKRECPLATTACMHAITPQAVWDAVLTQLQRPAASGSPLTAGAITTP